jgi:DNA-binding CsgD family transcriptional regulator
MLGTDDWLAILGLTSIAIELRDPGLAGQVLATCPDQPDGATPALRAGRLVLEATLAPQSALPALVADLVDCVRRIDAAGWHNPALFPVADWATPPLLRLGDTATARQLIAGECDAARAYGSAATLGRALRVWGTQVKGRYALSLLAEAVSVLRDADHQLELARALSAYGSRLRSAGRPGAEELLAEADGLVDELGTAWLRCWAEPGPERVALPGAEGLTGTERRVAGLVALGHTNQDVAETVGITRRAVEKCLTRLYRRLGVAGRAELIPAVQRIAGTTAL